MSVRWKRLPPRRAAVTAAGAVIDHAVAIHGRAGASPRDPLGTARSHGCIRVLNRHVSWMARKLPARSRG